jgi:hypothetical protein
MFAEEHKVEFLKEASNNAIRTAHNPPSTAFLDACDRLGALVLENLFDIWRTPKVKYDYSLAQGRQTIRRCLWKDIGDLLNTITSVKCSNFFCLMRSSRTNGKVARFRSDTPSPFLARTKRLWFGPRGRIIRHAHRNLGIYKVSEGQLSVAPETRKCSKLMKINEMLAVPYLYRAEIIWTPGISQMSP